MTPTFALSNQFLVWVAKKFLAQSDLDLVLTEYHKERLESRRKNRETHMSEDNSTGPTVSTTTTYLPAPIDWISSEKPSSTRPPFPLPTPPLSPLSLPSSSTQSITPVPCCYKKTYSFLHPFVTQSTYFESNLSPALHPSVYTREVNQEVMATNTPNTESTSTPPPFQASYMTPMHYPGAPGSPFFEGANVSEFLERFENICGNYRTSTSEKIRRLS